MFDHRNAKRAVAARSYPPWMSALRLPLTGTGPIAPSSALLTNPRIDRTNLDGDVCLAQLHLSVSPTKPKSAREILRIHPVQYSAYLETQPYPDSPTLDTTPQPCARRGSISSCLGPRQCRLTEAQLCERNRKYRCSFRSQPSPLTFSWRGEETARRWLVPCRRYIGRAGPRGSPRLDVAGKRANPSREVAQVKPRLGGRVSWLAIFHPLVSVILSHRARLAE